MKRIGLLSDTHGYLDDRIMHHLSDCDEIWHAGDIGTAAVSDQLGALKPYRAVYGNIDGHELRRMHKENLYIKCEGLNIWMTHIGGRPPRYAKGIREQLQRLRPDVFICGHSHILKVQKDQQLGVW
ncbi:MAG: metallophosphatase family protein, partial [Flavobacteriales bacterium]|nr:metallophosphatase family protein [Flavobacteriales bacterium]